MSGKEIQELLPCPFCGGTPKKILIGNDFTKKRSVEVKCTGCFTKQVTGAIRNSHEWCDKTATTVWNTRQLSPSSTAPQGEEEQEQLWAEFDKIARLWKQNGESPLSYHLKHRGFTIQKKQPLT